MKQKKSFLVKYQFKNCMCTILFITILFFQSSCFSFIPSSVTTTKGTLPVYSNKVCILTDENAFKNVQSANYFIGEFAMWLKSNGFDCRVNKDEDGGYTYIVPAFGAESTLTMSGTWIWYFKNISFKVYTPQYEYVTKLYLGDCIVENFPGQLRKVFQNSITIQRLSEGNHTSYN